MKKLIYFLALSQLVACKYQTKEPDAAPASHSQAPEQYGAPFSPEGAISVAETMMKVNSQDSVFVKTEGYVTAVCQVKGCWMQLSQSPNDTTGFFVKFKDYAFFVPLDLAGSKVVVSGKAYKEITSVEELRHYAEDEGKSPEEIAAITEPQEEMKFLSDGVLVIERKK